MSNFTQFMTGKHYYLNKYENKYRRMNSDVAIAEYGWKPSFLTQC